MQSTLLSRALMADALLSGAAGVLMILAGPLLAAQLNAPVGAVQFIGAAFLPWSAALIALARRASVPRGAVTWVIGLNAAWVAASIAVLFVLQPTALGYVLLIAQAVAVGVLAELQFVGLKRLPRTA